MENLKIVYLPVTALTPYERNAKEHPPAQIEQIKKSIQDYGMDDPIGIWGEDNIIVEGHGRLLACKALGFTEVPCIRLDHMTDAQRREYALVHNQTTMNSGNDQEILGVELDELLEFDAEFYGFDLDPVFDEDEEKPEKTDPTDSLPESKLYGFSISAFGVKSECFVEVTIPAAEAERLLEKVDELGAEAVAEKIMEAVNGL